MAFDINKAKAYASGTTQKIGGGFNIDKAKQFASGGFTAQPTSPLDISSAFDSIRQRSKEKSSIRIPFRKETTEVTGPLDNPVTRGLTNIIWRAMEGIFAGGVKAAAQFKGKDVKLPFEITYEPFFTGEPVTQSTFAPMSEAALDRIETLDKERPDKPTLNLLQGATEEIFLPLLDAVDIVGLSSLATRLTRKVTLSKPAQEAFKKLNMGLMSDTSEQGIKTHVESQMKRNLTQLEKGKITEQQFIKRQDDIGTALDTLIESPNTRFGKLGERTNRLTTALEAERRIGARTVADPLRTARESVRAVESSTPEIRRLAETMAQKVDNVVEAKRTGEVPSVDTARVADDTPQAVKLVDEVSDPLTLEARKYKSAEEFVKAQANFAHGGGSEITKFDARKLTKGGELGKGVYFSGDVAKAKLYGGSITNLKADLKNPLEITSKELWDNGGLIEKFNADPNYTKKLIEQGYDGIIVRNGNKVDQGVVFDVKNTLTKSQLTDIWERATKEASKVADDIPKPPTSGKKSKLAQRINEVLPEDSKISEFYDVKTIKGELEKAAEAIEKNPTKALSDALNPEKAMSGRAAKLMEFAQSARERGDVSVQSALLSKMRVLGTEIAQGLNMFKAFGLRNPETDFMEQVVNARLRKVAITDQDIARAGTPSRAYNEKVYKPVRREIENVKRQAFKVEDAQKLFDSLVC